jgi:hypothetical protein
MAHLPNLSFLIRLNNQNYQIRLILNELKSFVKRLIIDFNVDAVGESIPPAPYGGQGEETRTM